MKIVSRVCLALSMACLIPACFYDTLAGIKQDPKTGEITADIQNSPAAKTIRTVEVVTDATPIGPIVRGIGEGLLALAGIAASIRGKQWKAAAIATAQGVQNVVGVLDATHATQTTLVPSIIADSIKKAIDAAHDDHGVNQAIQNELTPTT